MLWRLLQEMNVLEGLCLTLLHQQFLSFLAEEPGFFIQLLQFSLTVYQAPFFLPHCSLMVVIQVIQLLVCPLKNLCQTKIDSVLCYYDNHPDTSNINKILVNIHFSRGITNIKIQVYFFPKMWR